MIFRKNVGIKVHPSALLSLGRKHIIQKMYSQNSYELLINSPKREIVMMFTPTWTMIFIF